MAVSALPSPSYSANQLTDDHQRISDALIIYKRKKIGQGAFGVVFKGNYKHNLCAVKVLHHVAMELITDLPGGEGMEESVRAFIKECHFSESFQHPNIVEHWAVERHPSSGSAILVTELMDCNLRSYLSGLGEESLTSDCEVSLSKDVASGLAYLHSKSIIHRDLCGDNILLKLRQPVPLAKISDFGMSRLLDPSRLSSTLTAMGHRMGYLPPEAPRFEAERYDHSLDVFSLGVIMVQIVHKLETVKSANDRSYYIAQISHTHTLKPLINTCLQEDMRRRPTAENVCAVLAGELTTEHEHRIPIGFHDSERGIPEARGGSAIIRPGPKPQPPTKDLLTPSDLVHVFKAVNHASKKWYNIGLFLGIPESRLIVIRIKHLKQDNRLYETLEWWLKNAETPTWDTLKRAVCSPAVGYSWHAENPKPVVDLMPSTEFVTGDRDVLVNKAQHNTTLQESTSQSTVTVVSEEITESTSQSTVTVNSEERTNLKMPLKMGITVHSVVMGGYVFVGGGRAVVEEGNDAANCTVMKLDLQQEEWTKLPQCTTWSFAMTTYDDQLVLVGGFGKTEKKPTNEVVVFKSEKWTHLFSELNIARYAATAASFNNNIVVVGGVGDNEERISSVEVLHAPTNKWYLAESSLPIPRSSMKSAQNGNTLYLMGGLDHYGDDHPTKVVYKVNLNDLVESTLTKKPTKSLWETTQDIPLEYSTPLRVGEHLFAIGGRDNIHSCAPTSSIHLYQHDTRVWVRVGELSVARFSSACSVLPSGEIIVAGGESNKKEFIGDVEFLSISS